MSKYSLGLVCGCVCLCKYVQVYGYVCPNCFDVYNGHHLCLVLFMKLMEMQYHTTFLSPHLSHIVLFLFFVLTTFSLLFLPFISLLYFSLTLSTLCLHRVLHCIFLCRMGVLNSQNSFRHCQLLPGAHWMKNYDVREHHIIHYVTLVHPLFCSPLSQDTFVHLNLFMAWVVVNSLDVIIG